MATLLPEMFEIPPKVVAAEKSRNLPKELQIENFRESKSNYYAAYSTMVYLEETAQKLFIETFNQTNISIFYEGNGNIFYILNDVSNIIVIVEYLQRNFVIQFTNKNTVTFTIHLNIEIRNVKRLNSENTRIGYQQNEFEFLK